MERWARVSQEENMKKGLTALVAVIFAYSAFAANATIAPAPRAECYSYNIKYRAFLINSVSQDVFMASVFQKSLMEPTKDPGEAEDNAINLRRVTSRIANLNTRLQELMELQNSCLRISPSDDPVR